MYRNVTVITKEKQEKKPKYLIIGNSYDHLQHKILCSTQKTQTISIGAAVERSIRQRKRRKNQTAK